jgi:NAD+ diphosphatase
MMSTLAGFVEPGETLEEAVAREVLEETGVRVVDVRYQGSQPWPFPSSLMLGFRAESVDKSAPVVNPDELDDARWFTRADVADAEARGLRLPGEDSIARRLILDWLGEH